MLAQFYQKIWSEAYGQNDSNILELLETNYKAWVVDIGCGDGQKTIKFKEKIGCRHIVGMDGVKERLKAAQKRGVSKVIHANIEEGWSFKSSSFDVVISNQVIEHLVDIDHSARKVFEEYGFKFQKGLGSGYYPLFGLLSRIAAKVDPCHSHFITIKMRKPI